MKPYPAYKDSGIEWIGEVPQHWDIKKLKYLVSSVPNSFVDGPFGSNLKNEEYQDSGIPLIQLNNIGIGKHLIQNLKFVSKEKSEELFKHKAYPNDIVIAKMAEPVARAAKVKSDFDVYIIVADCMKLSPNDALINTDYLIYSMNTDYVRTQAEMLSSGTTRIRIGLTDSKKIRILLPPLSEQQSVNNFLDHKASQIDTLIEKKQKQIELLNEERTAIINQAVTKGLNPDVLMKDSGIEWLGEVPEHWEIKSLKYIAEIVLGKMLTNEDKGDYFYKPYLRAQNIGWEKVNANDIKSMWFSKRELMQYRLKSDDLLISEGGEVGRTAIWNNEIDECYIQNSVHKVTMFKNCNPYYYLNLFVLYGKFGFFDSVVSRVSIAHLTREKLKEVKCLVPPLEEQVAIATNLANESKKMEQSILNAENQITFLQEYRTALISNAVTGKIDVRDTPTASLE